MKVGSLFSGIGGIELGFEKQGFTTEWFVECDRYAQTILRKHWPQAKIYDDVAKVDFRTVPKVEVLTGGFPCQDISNAGQRVGIEGSRSGLWKEFKRAISQVRPRYAFIENVSALTHRGLDTVLCDLAEIGYDAEWYCVRASDVGAWHRRERIFIIAYRTENVAYANMQRYQSSIRQTKIRQIGRTQENSGTEPCSADSTISDTDTTRLQRWKETRNVKESRKNKEQQFKRQSGYWAVEPDLGRTLDGFSSWMDKEIRKLYISHKLLVAYGNAKKERSIKILRTLRNSINEEIQEWKIRGQGCIPSEAVLFTYLCKLEERQTDKTWLQLEGKKIPEKELRSMWGYDITSCTPYKPGHKRQQERKHPDTLQALSRLLALHAEEAWIDYRRENATNYWESGIARIMSSVPNRVDRIKCLGNAVVPQVAEVFAKAIKQKVIKTK